MRRGVLEMTFSMNKPIRIGVGSFRNTGPVKARFGTQSIFSVKRAHEVRMADHPRVTHLSPPQAQHERAPIRR